MRADGVLTSSSVVRVSPLKLSGINGDFDGSWIPVERRRGVGPRWQRLSAEGIPAVWSTNLMFKKSVAWGWGSD